MNADLQDYKFTELTERIIKAFYKVYNTLGYGFLEKVYEKALLLEFGRMNISVVSQSPIKVFYLAEVVGEYYADILVENNVILEIKAVKNLTAEHEAQLLNYLKATNIEVGLLLNFGPEPGIKRKAFNNKRKNGTLIYADER